MRSEEIADFLEVDIRAVEFIISNKGDFYAYVGKNLRFDVVKPKSWLFDLFLWNEWVSIFEIPIVLDSSIYWICSSEKPIAPKDWVDFLIKNIIYLNKIDYQCFLYEGRHKWVKILGENAAYYTNDLDTLKFISEICFPNNLGISSKWYELSRKAVLSLNNLSEAKKICWSIHYELITTFLHKVEELTEKDQLPIFTKDNFWINDNYSKERIIYKEDYVNSIIDSILPLSNPLDVEKKLSRIHPFLKVKVLEKWVEEKAKLLRTPFEAKKFYVALFRKENEDVVLNKWRVLSREAILSLKDSFEAKKLYADCHPELKPAIIVFLSEI